MVNIVDIHTHVLPFIDDGAMDLSETMEMIETAHHAGTTDLICTPHFNPDEQNLIDFLTKREKIFNQVVEKVEENSININLYQGAEVYFIPSIIKTIDETNNLPDGNLLLKKLCLNNSRYMLLELPFVTPPNWVDQCIFELRLRNIVPIIAHPERYHWILDKKDDVFKWVQLGALLQINASSLLNKGISKNNKAIKFLKEHDLIHFIATDAHDPKRRNTLTIKEILSNKKLNNVRNVQNIENGFKVINNYDIIDRK